MKTGNKGPTKITSDDGKVTIEAKGGINDSFVSTGSEGGCVLPLLPVLVAVVFILGLAAYLLTR